MAKVLSLFDGMACGMLAMMDAGIEVERYVSFEIDKYATKTSKHNFPMMEQHGDVFEADFKKYEGFDYLIGGSPCTHWSIAQTKNRETTASGIGWELFSQYVRALKEAKPKYFIYENNKSMSKEIRRSITDTFGFEPICINSALVSAQNRNRLYWVGIRCADGVYKSANLYQPKDEGILLKDILETGGDLTSRDKSWTLTASYDGACAWNTIERNQRNMVAEPINVTSNNKSRTIIAQYGAKQGLLNSIGASGFGCTGVAEPIRVGAMPRPNGELSGSQGFRIYSEDGKSVALKGNAGGAGGKTGLYAECVDGLSNQNDIPVYEVKNGMISIKGKTYPIKLVDGYYIIRKLTVKECMRLQTVPEWYEFPVSKTQAYKMLGNGWTVKVISHLLKCIGETDG